MFSVSGYILREGVGQDRSVLLGYFCSPEYQTSILPSVLPSNPPHQRNDSLPEFLP